MQKATTHPRKHKLAIRMYMSVMLPQENQVVPHKGLIATNRKVQAKYIEQCFPFLDILKELNAR